ncbi:MAG TPA: hypothetical protein ENH82_19375 [bacterium]|nr:hypothetical protein [bacterium]
MNGLDTITRMNLEATDKYNKEITKINKRVADKREKTLAFLKRKTVANVVLVESEEYASENDTLTLFFTDGTKIEVSAISECDNAHLVLDSMSL